MEFGTSFPVDSEALEVVEQGEGLLNDVAEFAHALEREADEVLEDVCDYAVEYLGDPGAVLIVDAPAS